MPVDLINSGIMVKDDGILIILAKPIHFYL